MLIAVEQARSMAMYGTMAAEDGDPLERRKAIAATKVQIGKSGKFVGQYSVHLHGGIGTTMEYSVGHYFKRTTVIDMMFGDSDYHLAALAKAGGLVPVERD
jgi:alkylation response protein AidB-like acyl-CoA dehydrogenase